MHFSFLRLFYTYNSLFILTNINQKQSECFKFLKYNKIDFPQF